MIRVRRTAAVEAEQALQRPGRNGLTESEHAIWFFSGIPANRAIPAPAPTKAPNFIVYKSDAVKAALKALFGTRCAYCESPYAHLHSMEVEHFRPKGGYLDDSGRLTTPGYYWLAATYDNLLPSCIDCNRERKHSHRLKNGNRVMRKSGKANRFPLSPGTPRATCHADIVNERPLLLNPCTDHPHQHLRFLSNGFVEPAQTQQEKRNPKGLVTIDIYGLVREPLVGERYAWSLRMQSAMQKVLSAEKNRRKYPNDEEFRTDLANAERELKSFLGPHAKYRAMTRSMAATFDRIRTVAVDYTIAQSAWRSSKLAKDKEYLSKCVERLQAFLEDPSLDYDLITHLVEIPSASLG